MRKEIFVALCVIGLLVGWVGMASATTVTWTIMQDATMAGKGPGTDLLLGTAGDTTTGQNNSCNLSGAANCTAGATPGTGSWSFLALEMPQSTSCKDGTAPGQGGCATNADCGAGGTCLTCPENGSGYDTFSYMGNFGPLGCALGNGTMKACQELGTFKWTELKIGASESVAAGAGGTSVNLNPIGTPSGSSSNCGVTSFTSSANIGFWVGCNPVLGIGGTINGLSLNGRVYATTGTNSLSNCGYDSTEINSLRATADGKGANYLLVMCGTTAIPNTTGTTSPCLRGATVENVVVATTGANASSCTDANPGCIVPGTCAGGVDEAAE